MPAANAPFLFSKFIEGYQQGAAQSQLQRLQKAQSLMQIAQMRAKEVDMADTSEGRAAAWQYVQKSMDEAEKLIKGSDGLWSTIMGVFGKKKKQELQDPHEMFAALGLNPADSYRKETIGGPSPGQTQGQGQGLPAPPDEASPAAIREQLTPAPQNVNKDGVPIERAAPSSVGGPPISTIPNVPLPPPRMMGTRMEVPMPQWKTSEAGIRGVDVSKATRKGLELVRVAPGRTEYWMNGNPVSFGEFEKARDQYALEQFKSDLNIRESKQRIAEATEQHKVQLQQTREDRTATANAWADWRKRNNLSVDPDTYGSILTGVSHPSDKTTSVDIQDENGDTYREVRDLETGQPFPGSRYKLPDSAETAKIRPYMLGGKTFALAKEAYYANVMADEKVKDQLRRAQSDNLALTIKNKTELMAIREKRGKLDKADIHKAMTLLSPIARAAATTPTFNADGTVNPNAGKFDLSIYNATLRTLMLSDAGLSWDQVITAYGGDPIAADKSIEADAAKAARELKGGGGTAYNPSK